MRPGSRRFLLFTGLLIVGAAAELVIEACGVPDLDERGKACTETCPSGLPCIQGICGGDDSDAPVVLSACGDGVCAAIASAGWSGPFQLYDGNEANAPSCAPPVERGVLEASAEILAPPPADCAPCVCGPVGGARCGPAAITGYEGCVQCPNPTPILQDQASRCYTILQDGCGATASSVQLGPSDASGGSCSPLGGGATLPAFRWSRIARGCASPGAAEGAGCNPRELCVPRPARPFEPGICVSQAGDVACPGTPYRIKRLYHQNASDTRSCSPCGCLAPEGVHCPVLGVRLNTSDCTGATELNRATAPGCLTFVTPSTRITIGPAQDGSCPPSGGAPIGTVVPNAPLTVCCSE
jgi:hypothetical protein